MKILVPLKRVVDPYAKVRPTSDGSALDVAGQKFEINPFDEIAVEEAVRLRERLGGAEIIVVSIGPAECEEQLRKALAMGADSAILVESSENYDPSCVAKELAVVATEVKPDLILMGKQATDDDANQVGQMLAAILDLPQATFASKVDVEGATLVVARETDDGGEVLEMQLPALVTADLRLNEPRYIALPGIIRARSKPLEKRPPSAPPQIRIRVQSYTPSPARTQGVKLKSVDELFDALKAKGLI